MQDQQAPFPIVAVLGIDWSYYAGEEELHQNFRLAPGWTVGLLVKEDQEKLVIAHQYFTEGQVVRHTSVISKETIRKRIDLGNGTED